MAISQEPRLDPDKTVGECIEDAVVESRRILDRFNELSMKLCEDLSPDEMERTLDEQARVQDEIDHRNLWELDRTLEIAADAMQLPPADQKVSVLSGGEKRRVALCQLLLSNPDMLLLDEPTNHLDARSVQWLEQFLASFTGTVVAVTHDRYFLDNVAGWILELDRGKGIPFEGNYTSWLEQKQKRLELEERRESRRQKELKRELEWVRMSPKPAPPKTKLDSSATTNSPPSNTTNATTPLKSRSPSPANSDNLSSKPKTSPNPSATNNSSADLHSISRPVASSVSSALTAPAKPRSFE
ncbi:MAG UNVERIFIED_CONTAM: ATP-binding cassette domain-containing protein [Planctomycetaceae bacterium]